MGDSEQLHIDVVREADRVVIALDGELDMASAPLLQSAFEDAHLASPEMIVLDLRRLRFVDSTGLRIILAARNRCRDRGQQLAVTRGSEQVERLLAVTGMSQHLQTVAAPD
jgi:anti-sigma B factor antagonist